MKFLIIGTLLAVANSLSVRANDEAHQTIFETCSSDGDCPAKKWCNRDGGAWSYCMDCCYPFGEQYSCQRCK